VISIPGTLKVITADTDDDCVLECAVVGKADYVVSGDGHLLALGTHDDVRVVKAAEFLRLIQSPTETM
jgi:predicted nucleic acid-binding protein